MPLFLLAVTHSGGSGVDPRWPIIPSWSPHKGLAAMTILAQLQLGAHKALHDWDATHVRLEPPTIDCQSYAGFKEMLPSLM